MIFEKYPYIKVASLVPSASKSVKIVSKKLEKIHAERREFNRDQVVALTKKYLSPEDVAFVQKALVYAVDCHNGQFRQSGEPYIIHPIQVAGILPS